MPLSRTFSRLARRVGYLLALVTLCAGGVSAAPPLLATNIDQISDSPFNNNPVNIGFSEAEQIVLGDVDNDGDLDLVIGNYAQPHQLYRNNGTAQPFVGVSGIPIGSGDNTTSIALGDVDNDGDLDLVTGNLGKRNQLYRNNGTAQPWAGVSGIRFGSEDSNSTKFITLGDVDSDGDLDLVTVNLGQPNQMYRNNGTAQPWNNVSSVPIGSRENTESIALGDVDSDGDLDLVAGNLGQQDQLYLNNGTAQPWAGVKGVPIGDPDSTFSIALGDVDNDGDLDLVTGNSGTPNLLYRNNGSSRPWVGVSGVSIGPPERTEAITLGDVDGDGKLDLINGNSGQPDRLYLNNGTVQPFSSESGIPIGPGDNTTSTALGDVDGDGDLDLVTGNRGQPVRLFRNNDIVQPWGGVNGVPISSAENTESIALGDVDGDHDLDLIAGNLRRPDQLYRNNGTAQPFAGVIGIPIGPADNTVSIALGDVDGDGDLDLVTGNLEQPDRLYRNNGSTQPWAGVSGIPIGPPDNTESIALGDVDGDGDLDLITGNRGTQSQLYRNNGTSQPWVGVSGIPIGTTDNTKSIALGDVDGDSDLDLVTGNFGQPGQLYRNNGTAQPWASVGGVAIGPAENTESIALGDVDGDGNLDLVYGNLGQPDQLYLNNGTAQPWADVSGIPIGPVDSTFSIALGDVNGDGNLDLVAGGSPDQLYLNNGTVQPWAGVSGIPLGSEDNTKSIALGDVDGNGDLDIVTTSALYYNVLHIPARQINQFPHIAFQQPARPQNPAPLRLFLPLMVIKVPFSRLSTATVFEPALDLAASHRSGIIKQAILTIPYFLTDTEGDAVREVRGFYSLDGGGQWQPAIAATGTITRNLAASPLGTPHTFGWDLAASGVFGRSDNTVVRLIAIPSVRPTRGQAAGPFQRAYSSTTTAPFSVRGAQVRVLQDGQPVGGALVYRLAAGQTRNAQPIPPQRPDHPQLRTDHLGFLQGRAQFAAGDQLVALAPISSTATYTMYLTSAHPIPTGLGATTISGYGDQTLTISRSNPLILFNLSVALEWDARADSAFVRQLDTDLKRASELLFRWSGGQAALGDITVYNNREHWDDAHIRIYATNRLRPNAIKGGIVDDTLPDPNPTAESYRPGQLRMGSIWNRYGDATANLGDDWARAFAHEIGHFALFLDDNYLGLDEQKRLVSVDGCPGAMTDPYRDDFGAFHPDAGWLPGCARTLSQLETERSDWATIKALYDRPALGFALNAPPAFAPAQNPALLPLAVTRVVFQGLDSAGAGAPLEAPVLVLTAEDGQQLLAGAGAHGFVFQGDRLLDVGKPNLDQLLARGARSGDRVCVYELDRQRLGCQAITASFQALPLAEHADWQPDISITPVNSTTLSLEVGNLPPELELHAQLYPTNGPARPTVQLTATNGLYQTNLTTLADAPAFEGYVHIWVDEPEPRRETVIDFLLGGNPGLKIGRGTPRGSPGLKIGRGAPVISSDGQALLFNDTPLAEGQFFALQTTSSLPAPPSWATLVGRAYRLTSSPGVSLAGSSINIGYLGDEVPRGQEAGIRVFFWDEAQRRWTALTTRLDQQRNEASASINQPGFYTLMTSIDVPLANAGWNLVYFYPGVTQPITDALAGIDGHYTTVYGYDTADASDPWKLYDVGVPSWVNELSQLQFGQGYWINATEPITVPVRGGTPSGQRTSASDPGILAAPPATYYGTLQPSPGFTPAAGLPVTATIGGVTCGQAQTRLVDGQVVLAIDVLSAASQPGCGAPGQIVAIAVGSLTFSATWDNGRPHLL